jgi:hypothetical protein
VKRRRAGQRREEAGQRRGRLFVEKAGLGGRGSGCSGGFAPSDADNAKDGQFGKRGAGNEDAVCVGAEIGRSDLQAIIEQTEEIIGDYTLEDFAIGVAHANPQAIEFRAAEENFSFGFEFTVELADKIDRTNAGEGDFLVLALGGKQVNRVAVREASGIEITAKEGLVGERDDDFLMSRGWGARLQRSR